MSNSALSKDVSTFKLLPSLDLNKSKLLGFKFNISFLDRKQTKQQNFFSSSLGNDFTTIDADNGVSQTRENSDVALASRCTTIQEPTHLDNNHIKTPIYSSRHKYL